MKRKRTSRAVGAGWEPTLVAGVEVRPLYVDTAADRITMLVRMAPGTTYPPPTHPGPVDCYVLLGDLRCAGVRFTAGDFRRSESGNVDDAHSTEEGCLLLIVGSTRDRVIPASSG